MTLSPLPSGWTTVPVGEIADSIQYGHTASAKDLPTGPRFLRITDIQNGHVNWSSVPSCEIRPEEIDKYRLMAGDIVFARTGATTGKSFLIKDCPVALFASYLIRLRMRPGIDPAYVSYFFQSSNYWRQIEVSKRGIGQPNVNGSVLAEVSLPIAPTEEQRRIVEKIDELFCDLDAGMAALERVRANLKRYRASVLNAAVTGKLTEAWRQQNPHTEPADTLMARILKERRQKWEVEQLRKFVESGRVPPSNWHSRYKNPVSPELSNLPQKPADWIWCTADQLCFQITDGEHIQPPYQAVGRPMLTATHVRNSHVEFKDVGYISEENFAKCLKRCAPQKFDLLIVSVGATTGRAGLVGDVEPFAIVRSVLMLRPLISPPFLLRWVQSPWCARWITMASGASAQAHFYIADAKRMPVPLPPESEQQQIMAEVELRLSVVDAVEAEIEHGLQRASRLRQAILKRAFEGKLVPQDSSDAPASQSVARSGRAGDDPTIANASRKPKNRRRSGPEMPSIARQPAL